MEKNTGSHGETLSFETSIDQLQAAVRRLESGDLSLEESLASFEEGVQLAKACQEYLQKAERRIEILTQGSSKASAQLEPFDAEKGKA